MKAIRYKMRSFECTREVGEDGDEVLKISLFEKTLGDRHAVIDFSFWEDGGMSLVTSVANEKPEKGWYFSHSISGHVDVLEPRDIVSRFENTAAETKYESLAEDGQPQLVKLWKGVELEFHSS